MNPPLMNWRARAAFALLILLALGASPLRAEPINELTRRHIDSLMQEKLSRTPAQRKLDSQLHYFAKRARGERISAEVASLDTGVLADGDNRILVDIKATVTPALLDYIAASGGAVVNHQVGFGAIRARLPIQFMEKLAARQDVRFLSPAALFTTNLGTVSDQGDRTHRADAARLAFPTNGGAGLKIGVMSNGVASLAASIANGNINANATVISGQAGSGDEGTAMMEIVQDLVPNAQLYFATANGGNAQMAANIISLAAAGCSVIVDDVSYFNESPFQDQVINQAVTTVSNQGVMYFSSARNSGSLDKGTSGTWEGDYADGGAATIGTKGGELHNFGGGTTFDTVTSASSGRVDFFWSDPLGASSNDYDLFITDATGAVLRSSTNIQNGTQDPYESVSTLNTGERIVIVKTPSAQPRFLHVDTGRSVIAIGTAGNVRGHNCATAANAFSVAATDVNHSPSPGFFVGGSTNPVETFSSDGPRRMFYNPDGSAITPGNVSSTGGSVFQKPDITAGDGVTTSVAGFAPFYGTSAAAPHAAAIAALIKSYNPTLTPAQIRTLMMSTALDIEGTGFDRDTGSGIVMALPAIQAAPAFDPLGIVSTGLAATGLMGGPFTPSAGTYTLTNNSGSPLNFAATKTQSWSDISPAGGTLAPGASTIVTVSLNAAAAALGLGSYSDTVTITNVTTGFTAVYPISLSVNPPQPTALFDSDTGAQIITTTSTPHTVLGMPIRLGSAGGTSNITVAGGTAYLGALTTASYTNIRLNVTIWGAATNATSGTTPAFSNSLGTYSFDFGPLSAVAGTNYTYNFTLPAPVVMPAQAGGITLSWQGDLNDGNGLVFTTNLESDFRGNAALAVGSLTAGTAGTNGFYLNVSNRSDANFLGSDFRLFGGVTNQGVALKLFTSPTLPLAVTSAASGVAPLSATLQGQVNPAGANTTATFQYGTSTSYGTNVPIPLTPSTGTVAQNVSTTLIHLSPSSTYHFRVSATNAYGTINGRDFTFTTGADTNPIITDSITPVSYLENQGPTVIDSALTLTDSGSATLTGATVAITSNFAAGQDFLNFSAHAGITGTYDPNHGILTLSGSATLSIYQVVLRSVTYFNSSNNPSSLPRTITFTGIDANGSGSDSRVLNVTPVNDAPTLDAIADQTPIAPNSGQQSVSLTGITAGGGESQNLTVTVTGNTNPTLIPTTGITYTSPNATGTLTYAPAANVTGAAILTVQVMDDGGTANGGVDHVTRSFMVTVYNAAPITTNSPTTLSYLENAGAVAIDPGLTVTDIDTPMLVGATVTITGNFSPAEDSLAFTNQNGISGTYNPTSGQLALTGTATVAAYQAALRSVTYADSSNGPSTALRTITFTADDGQSINNIGTSTSTIAVVSVNDPPSGANNTATTLENSTYSFAIADFGFTDSIDFPANQFLAVEITTLPAAGTLTDNGVPVVAGQFIPVADITAGLLVFTPAAHGFGTGYAAFTFQVQDNGGTANGGVDVDPTPKAFVLNVTGINDPPTLTAISDPAPILEDAPAQIISLTGISAGPGETQNLTITATSSNPALIPNPLVTYTSPDATGTLTYTPAPNASGSATITVQIKDDGGTDNGGHDTTVRMFTVQVIPVNDPPTLDAIADPAALLEDAPAQTIMLSGITAGPGETQNLTVTAKSSNPALIPDPEVAYTSPNATGSLTFTPVADANGTATITVQVKDDGGTDNGGVDIFERTFTVTVTAVNNAPSFTGGPGITVLEDAGPQMFAGWATNLSAGPSDESTQALNFLVQSDHPALFSAGPAIDAGGMLTFTTAPNANGTATVTVRLHDDGGTENGGVDTSGPQIFTITVGAVNDAPSFTRGSDQNVRQNVGPQTVPNWATNISAGPPDESGQTLNFLVSNDNAALFRTPPAISPDGTLTYEPDPSVIGSATVTVRLHDNGGTLPGVDTSAAQTFVITTIAVNHAPSFTVGPVQKIAQNMGLQTVAGWATNISAGPSNESTQKLNFMVSVDNPALFSTAPAISPDGTLTFASALNASGSTTVTVRLHDDGGTGNGGADTSAAQTFQIYVTSYLEEVGTYNGLATAAGASASVDRVGLIKVTFVRKGSFTGFLVLGGKRFALLGKVDNSGAVTFGKTNTPSLELKRTGLDSLFLQLTLDVSEGTDKLSGTIDDGAAPFATIEADRALFSSAKRPIAPLRNVPAEWVGSYTIRFAALSPADQGEDASLYPQGDGVGRLTIATTGVARVTGTLADGTAVSYANSLSKLGAWPIYLPLSSTRGALTGPAQIEDRPGLSDLDGLDLHWFKPATSAKRYPQGWPAGIGVDLLGSKYDPTTSFAGLQPVSTTGNVQVDFTGASLATPGLSSFFNLRPLDKIAELAPNPNKLSLTITRSTGLISGSFVPPGSKARLSFHAVLFQKQASGQGYFLDPTASGAVTFSSLPAPTH